MPSEEKKEKPKNEEPIESDSLPFFIPGDTVERKVDKPFKLKVPK